MAVVRNPLNSIMATGDFGNVSFHPRQKRKAFLSTDRRGRFALRFTSHSGSVAVARKKRTKHPIRNRNMTRYQPMFGYFSKLVASLKPYRITLTDVRGGRSVVFPDYWYDNFSAFSYLPRTSVEAVQAYRADQAVVNTDDRLFRLFPPDTLYKHSTIYSHTTNSSTTYRTWLINLLTGKRWARWFISTNLMNTIPDVNNYISDDAERLALVFPDTPIDPLTSRLWFSGHMAFHLANQLATVAWRAYAPTRDFTMLTLSLSPLPPRAFTARGDTLADSLYDPPILKRRRLRG